MADFNKAYEITLKNEGGYVNDPTDAGGETFKGISRKYHPSWPGWKILDLHKKDSNFPKNSYKDSNLDVEVKNFYKANYWDINLLDQCLSQNVANELFDTGVNMGTARAAKFLQRALNLLNKNNTIYEDIVEDGKIGIATINALTKCINYKGDEYLYKILNILQGQHYIDYMTKSPTQEKYAYGWLSRVEFIKNNF